MIVLHTLVKGMVIIVCRCPRVTISGTRVSIYRRVGGIIVSVVECQMLIKILTCPDKRYLAIVLPARLGDRRCMCILLIAEKTRYLYRRLLEQEAAR